MIFQILIFCFFGTTFAADKIQTVEIYRSQPPGVLDQYIFKKQGNKEVLITTSNYFNASVSEAGTYTRLQKNNYEKEIRDILKVQSKKKQYRKLAHFHKWNLKIEDKVIDESNPKYSELIELIRKVSNETGWKKQDVVEIQMKPDFKVFQYSQNAKKSMASKSIFEVCNKMTNNRLTCEVNNKFIYID